MKKLRIGIVGGAGYTGGELLRLLLRHPGAEIAFVHSSSQAGKPVHAVHGDLFGETELQFTGQLHRELDVLFLCLGHGGAAEFLRKEKVDPRVKLIDLSQDFRLAVPGREAFVYGLPELDKEAIRAAERIANPGCFATAIQLALLPLAGAGLLSGEVHISATTGSTGAGQALSPTSHFSWRSGNLSVYKAFQHQHLGEIHQSLRRLQPDFREQIRFIPLRGGFTRGILAAVYLKSELDAEAAQKLYQTYYRPHPFVHVTPQNPDLKQVINTNNCLLYLEKHDDTLLIVSVIDNLLKGASGQAVQNMNLMTGFDETAGLKLKANGF